MTGEDAIDHNGLLEQFEAHLTRSALAPATVVNYLADLRAFLRWSRCENGAGRSPLSLNTADIQAYCAYLEKTKSHVPATVNRRLQTLRKFFDFAITQGWALTNPASDVALLGEEASERTRSLTAADISRLLAAVRAGHPNQVDRDWAIIQILMGAGLKLSELSQLRLADVHLGAHPPYVLVLGAPGALDRAVPLDSEVGDALRAYLPTRQAIPEEDHFFVNRNGNMLSTRSIQRLVRRYAKAAELENLTTQSLRYVYAKKAYERSGDIGAVARLLGHRHLATTIRYLQPCLPEEQERT